MQNYNSKVKIISLNLIPIILMIGLIPLIKNDYWLTTAYFLIIAASFLIKYEKREYVFLLFGFFGMMLSEYFFISTGVETFNRNSLFGLMPIWLPILWGYGFVVMKRAISIIEQ